jgi:hypothetical protein
MSWKGEENVRARATFIGQACRSAADRLGVRHIFNVYRNKLRIIGRLHRFSGDRARLNRCSLEQSEYR